VYTHAYTITELLVLTKEKNNRS